MTIANTTRNALYFIFFTQPIILGAWLPRIPEVQEKLMLSPAELAMSLIGAPVGTLFVLLFAGKIGDALGAKKTMAIFYPLFFIAMFLPFLAPSQFTLAVALAAFGSSISILELGMNISADQVEKHHDKLVMSKAHGLWSFGLMAGTLIGAGAATLAVDPLIVNVGLTILFLPTAYFAINKLSIPNHQKPVKSEKRTGFAMPHPILLAICAFTFGTTLVEGAVADWAAIFMRDAQNAGPGLSGLALTVFTLIVAVTRLSGDRLRKILSTEKLAFGLAFVGLAGVATVYFSPNIFVAFIGFGMIGLGASLAFPLAVSAAANAPGRSVASNVATLTFLALTGFLVGPISIGFIAEYTNIRVGLLVLGPALMLSALLAFSLKPNPSTPTNESPAS
ncbi:MFS transporter [Maritalea sp.]|uniref:MFS transporter n=1 Tax=Maritalea sp. TaxID=2003361 RepID=UPI003EF77BCA